MNVLNILSSHYDASFNSVLMNEFEKSLSENGHQYETMDLYKDNFNPVMNGDDFNQFMNKDLPEELILIQNKIKSADIITFFYPVWWCDMPAIMKGWIDRVFAKSFAYDYGKEGTKGLLTNIKKVVLVCTLGNKEDNQNSDEIELAMRDKEKYGVFGYCGVKEVEHHFLYDVYQSEELRNSYIQEVKNIAKF
jgi:NAD(P)H dehydrogenase (quinone)